MATFMLLLHESPAVTRDLSPAEVQGIIDRYKAWAEGLGRSGRLRGGDKLGDGEGRVMRAAADGRPVVTDGPYAESKEVVAGYFLLEAADYDEAVALAGDCPHLAFGTVEVRRIEPT
jgi:hypothetical protein